MDRQLTAVERSILCSKDRKTGLKIRLDAETDKWWARLIDECDLEADHLRVLRRRGKKQLDKIGKESWAKLVKVKKLSAADLRESIKRGSVTRIKIEQRSDGRAGIANWPALKTDFDILRRQIADSWRDWRPEEINYVRCIIAPILTFDQLVATKASSVAAVTHEKRKGKSHPNRTACPDISKCLREWRRREVLTQPGAAKSLGVPIRTYQDWEQGRRVPRGPAFWNIQRRIAN